MILRDTGTGNDNLNHFYFWELTYAATHMDTFQKEEEKKSVMVSKLLVTKQFGPRCIDLGSFSVWMP